MGSIPICYSLLSDGVVEDVGSVLNCCLAVFPGVGFSRPRFSDFCGMYQRIYRLEYNADFDG